MIKVSIIIVNYNTKELLDNCIESVYEKSTSKNFEIIFKINETISKKIKELEFLKEQNVSEDLIHGI